MRKILSKFVLLLAVLTILVSCEFEETSRVENLSEGKAAVKFVPSISPEKGLEVKDDPEFTWLKYQAIPGYGVQGAAISGATGDTWEKLVTKSDDCSFTTAYVFTQGYWTFNIEVGNDEVVYYTGTATAYLTADDNPVVVNVELLPKFDSSKTGTLNIKLSTPALSDSAGSFKIEVFDSEMKAHITNAKNGDSEIDFDDFSVAGTLDASKTTASINQNITLHSGIYILQIQYISGTDATEKAIVAFKVVEGCTSSLEGTLENGSYVSSKLTLKHFNGTLVENLNDHTYTFTPEEDYPGTITYLWFINGTAKTADQGHPETFTFTEKGNGAFCLSCVAIYKNGSNCDVVSLSKIVEGLPTTK